MLSGQYEAPLVLISIAVAMLASYTALSLASRVAHSDKSSVRWWIGGGAFAMGTGIWAMHFIGMLAFRLPIPVGYEIGLTVLSWLIPVLVSALALWQISRAEPRMLHLAFSSLLIGLGINAMHYVGMAAMRIEPGIVFKATTVALSVTIAIAAAAASLWIAFMLSHRGIETAAARLGGSVIMGAGIAGMHYTGMASAQFPENSICTAAQSGLSLDSMAITVILATLALLVIALVTSGYDIKLRARLHLLNLTQTIAEERFVLLERERTAREAAELARSQAESAQGEAERMSAVKDEFLATLSHELRTPLNAVLGWSQLLLTSADLEPDVSKGLEVIERSARVQGRLIEDLLDMSGLARKKVCLERKLINPVEFVRAAIDAALPSATRKSVAISQSLDEHVSSFLADSTRLAQVVGNLITNAIKFTPQGGRVHISLAQSDGWLQISVTDTGVGIPLNFLPHVFDLFRQADASTTRRHGGLGIGLSIVKQLVELHGGTVSAASDGEGTGATFSVRLPVATMEDGDFLQVSASQQAHDPQCSKVDLSGLTIFVVDDEEDGRQVVKAILEEHNAQVITAENGFQALRLIADTNPNILISDIGMPGMDGFELIRHVRDLDHNIARVPAVALSAYTRGNDRDQASVAGFNRYLEKPLDGSLLVSLVATLTNR